MHNLCHRSRLGPWLGQHNSMWGKCSHLWHHHPHKSTMHHQYNLCKPSPPLHPLHWDKCSHNKTVPTSLPPIINQRKLGITGPTTKVITNRREAFNNQTLPTMPRLIGQPKTSHNRMRQDAMLRCAQTNHAHSVMFMDITNSTVPSWLTLSNPFIRGNLGSKMGLIRKHAKISYCELEFKNQ